MSNDINIKSSTIEKGVELAKDFLDKLVMPAVEETGLLIKEKVTYWKFKNQVKVLNKAKEYCEKHGIKPHTISFKLLVPLLETSSLEEDEVLQDKWAILLSNMVDSEQNVENHVFPYILGQISINEFLNLEKVVAERKKNVIRRTELLHLFQKERPQREIDLKQKIETRKEEIEEERGNSKYGFSDKLWKLQREKSSLEMELRNMPYSEKSLIREINEPESVPTDNLKEFEISNLIRLGLIKYVQEAFSGYQSLEIPNNKEDDYLSVDFDIDVDFEENYILTELGELFIDACTEKKTAPNNGCYK
ncbi:Abi-alpha family protein [Galbibacter sp. EGI 63066]|uniref:Abi-alpha family protein n=1 Tax=Galbibacter sp. EGI 63066 TaxID=2993559 RepID=UPI002249576F|nr:Abi-alpha family protein [Galbibacter sp. EGI 63066]MCX2680943.1 Abi-alpha family protein [Galbibacter sp. EGI 63066]